jgi:hypothetical protein
MWTDMKSREARDALVKDYLERKKRLQTRFESKKLGEADLFTEAAKLFKPITAETAKQEAELEKVTKAIERLPAQIAAEADFNPIAALFDEGGEGRKALPAPAPQHPDPTPVVNADRGLDVETIKRYGFKLPSELDQTNTEAIDRLIDGINRVNTYKLGAAKRKAKTTGEELDAIERDQDALREYRARVRLLAEGYKLTERTGKGLKMRGNQFGGLTIDPVALTAGRLRAYNGGNLVFEAPADESLHSLLTKRFVKTKRYTPDAVETFKKLVELAGLPVHGRKSKKHQLISGGGAIQYYNDPETLVERLQLLLASKQAGNTGLDNEISAILDELMRTGAIPKEFAIELNKSLLSA